MSVKFSNNGKTSLSSGITSSATSIPVLDASVFPSISGSEYFYVTLEDGSGNVEILKVTAVSSNTLTVTRAQDGSSARAFAAGDKAENRLTAGGLNDVATQADTDTDTTYSAGSGLSLTGTTFANTAPDQTVAITGSGATSVSGTYPNFTVSSTDTNTTYSVGDGGLTQKNFTTALKSKLDGIASGAEVNVNADWNASSGDAQILNKPTIPSLTGYATESYVDTQVSNLVDSSPAALDTLNELAAALGDDANFSTTVSNQIGTKWTQDNTKISNWDTAYGWGNHASAGYLTSFDITTQTDSKYVRSDTSDTMSGNLTVTGTITSGSKSVGTQSVVTTAPTSASGFPNGHVWYVVS